MTVNRIKGDKGMKQEVYIISAGHRLDERLLRQEEEMKYFKENSPQKKVRKKNNRKKTKRR